MTDTADTWVVIPAFNDSAKIGEVVAGVLRIFTRVVVVDDGSSDDTAAKARTASAHVVVDRINLARARRCRPA